MVHVVLTSMPAAFCASPLLPAAAWAAHAVALRMHDLLALSLLCRHMTCPTRGLCNLLLLARLWIDGPKSCLTPHAIAAVLLTGDGKRPAGFKHLLIHLTKGKQERIAPSLLASCQTLHGTEWLKLLYN